MSAQVHEVGSVVSFSPSDREWVVAFYGVDDNDVEEVTLTAPVIGFATVVIKRSMWVVTTEVQVVAICCGRPRPMDQHVNVDQAHYPVHWEVERA